MHIIFLHKMTLTVPNTNPPPWIQINTAASCFLSLLGAHILTAKQSSLERTSVPPLPLSVRYMALAGARFCKHPSAYFVACRTVLRGGGICGGCHRFAFAYGIPRNWRTVGALRVPVTAPCPVGTVSPESCATWLLRMIENMLRTTCLILVFGQCDWSWALEAF